MGPADVLSGASFDPPLAAATDAQGYGRLVVFGDSYSDNGNVFANNGGLAPTAPYYQGRFSNGAVWTEQLGFSNLQGYGAVTNNVDYAFGGVRTGLTPRGLQTQYGDYTAHGGSFGPADLVVIWGGTNDIGDTLDAGGADPLPAANQAATAAALNVASLVRQAAAAGAGTILVVDLPDMGTLPHFHGALQAAATAASQTFDTALAGEVDAAAAASPDATVILMDVRPLIAAMETNPAAFGFADGFNSTVGVPAATRGDPDRYLFFDGYHYTAAANRILAAYAKDYLFHDDVHNADDSVQLWGTVVGDALAGGSGNDVIIGLGGNDTVDGGAGSDDLNGNVGQDLVRGGDGADIVRGGKGNDTVQGDAGDDPHVNGNQGDDVVHGGTGNDTVFGGQGNDTVYGDEGADRISGDLGADLLYGGAGADLFVVAKGGGQDWVADFNGAEGDRVLLAPGTGYTVTAYQGQVLIDLGSGDAIGLVGVSPSSFNASWVVFG